MENISAVAVTGKGLICCETQRLELVRELAGLCLPVGTPEEMERESVAAVEPLP